MATRDLTRGSGTTGSATSDGMVKRLATETKAAFKTTEFYVFLAVLAGILVAAAVIEGAGTGDADFFKSHQAWLYITILASAYMISRGLAKSGSRDPYWSDSGQNRVRSDSDGNDR
jgi:hypothetical protein